MRPRRPKQYCLQLVIYIYVYIYIYIYIYVYIYVFIHIKTYQEAILINMDIFIININFFKY